MHAAKESPIVAVSNPMIGAALKADLPTGASYLLSHADGAWKVDRSWPYPGYDDPATLPE